MVTQDMSKAARTTPVTFLTDTEAQIDMKRLRAYRLGRLRAELKKRDYGAAVLLEPISIRYATGSRNGTLILTHLPARYLFVATEGPVILFDAESYRHVAAGLETVTEYRPALPLTVFYAGPRLDEMFGRWAEEIADLVKAHSGGNKRLAVDRLDPRAAAVLARHGIDVKDANEPVEHARAIKSADEVMCMNVAVATAEIGAARMREALRPGMTDTQLWAILHQTNIEMGGEWIDCRLLTSGDRVNPWLQETVGRYIRPGELVAFDTDMIGPFGYCADFSRTFHCGPGKPTPEQRDLYKLAYEEVHTNMALVKPGLSFREFTEKHWKQPEPYIQNRYPFIAHGIGMCDEYPGIYYRQDWPLYGYDGVIEENMTLCVESYMGAAGGFEGVKLEQQVLVTRNGCVPLSRFPFEDALLA